MLIPFAVRYSFRESISISPPEVWLVSLLDLLLVCVALAERGRRASASWRRQCASGAHSSRSWPRIAPRCRPSTHSARRPPSVRTHKRYDHCDNHSPVCVCGFQPLSQFFFEGHCNIIIFILKPSNSSGLTPSHLPVLIGSISSFNRHRAHMAITTVTFQFWFLVHSSRSH